MPLKKIGSEFLVNTYTTSGQQYPSVTSLTNGNFVVTWTSYGQTSGGTQSIYAQIFTPLGNKVGSEILVNIDGYAQAQYSSVTSLTNGNFVVSWQANGGADNSGNGVHAQLFTSAGIKVGSEFLINTYTTNDQTYPSTKGLNNGNFVVAWESDQQDGSNSGIYGQIFTPAGVKLGTEFLVNTYTTKYQSNPSVSGLINSNFVVTWQSYQQAGPGYSIYGQIFSPTGTRVGSEFLIFTDIVSSQSPSVASLENTNFMVTCTANSNIYGQVFTPTGTRVGSEFQINTFSSSGATSPCVIGLSNNNVLVTWRYWNQEGYGAGVYAQVLDATGNKLGSEFLVNTYTIGNQMSPSVTSLSNGNVVITWQSDGQIGSKTEIYAQIYYPFLGITFLDQPARYTENKAFNIPSIEIAPINYPSVTATLIFSNPLAGTLDTATSGSVTSSYSASTGIWRASGAVEDVNTLLAKIKCVPSLDFNSNFNITIAIQDQMYTLDELMIFIGPPVLSSINTASLVFTEHDAPLVLDSSLTLKDVNANFAQAIIAITSGFTSKEDSLSINNPNYISNNYNSATGVLTLTGSSSLANYQSALQSVRYQNLANNNPNYIPRSISFTAQDSDGVWTKPLIKSVNIIPDYSPPKLERNSLTIAQGAGIILTTTNLAATDLHTETPLLEFTVNNVQNGHFETIFSAGAPINNFRQSEIIDQTIRFIHNGKPEKPAYDVTVNNLDGLSDGPAGATIAFTPAASNHSASDIVRNTIIGTAVSGAMAVGFFALKLYLARKADKSFDKALNADNDAELKAFRQTVIRPIARKIKNKIKIRGNFDCDVENSNNTLVDAVGEILSELHAKGINVDFTQQSAAYNNHLINQIAIQIKAKLVPKNQYAFCSMITGFYAGDINPEHIRDNAKEIATAVANVLKTTPASRQSAVLSNDENDIEMEELEDNSKNTQVFSHFQHKNTLSEKLTK